MNTQLSTQKYSTFKCFTAPEKEEAWLEQMALRGWFLTRVTGFYIYIFEQGAPEKRAYKIDYRSFRKPSDREDYLTLFKDSGWQPVMSREANGAFYFYSSPAAGGQKAMTDIFSDDVSRARRNLRYATLMAYSIIPAFLPLIVLYLTGSFNINNVGYLTPGLWQMTGAKFLFHFLFETPFVLLRSGAYIIPLIPVVLSLIFLLRYYLLYQKAAREQSI